jgi:hypothetical protein
VVVVGDRGRLAVDGAGLGPVDVPGGGLHVGRARLHTARPVLAAPAGLGGRGVGGHVRRHPRERAPGRGRRARLGRPPGAGQGDGGPRRVPRPARRLRGDRPLGDPDVVGERPAAGRRGGAGKRAGPDGGGRPVRVPVGAGDPAARPAAPAPGRRSAGCGGVARELGGPRRQPRSRRAGGGRRRDPGGGGAHAGGRDHPRPGRDRPQRGSPGRPLGVGGGLLRQDPSRPVRRVRAVPEPVRMGGPASGRAPRPHPGNRGDRVRRRWGERGDADLLREHLPGPVPEVREGGRRGGRGDHQRLGLRALAGLPRARDHEPAPRRRDRPVGGPGGPLRHQRGRCPRRPGGEGDPAVQAADPPVLGSDVGPAHAVRQDRGRVPVGVRRGGALRGSARAGGPAPASGRRRATDPTRPQDRAVAGRRRSW